MSRSEARMRIRRRTFLLSAPLLAASGPAEVELYRAGQDGYFQLSNSRRISLEAVLRKSGRTVSGDGRGGEAWQSVSRQRPTRFHRESSGPRPAVGDLCFRRF